MQIRKATGSCKRQTEVTVEHFFWYDAGVKQAGLIMLFFFFGGLLKLKANGVIRNHFLAGGWGLEKIDYMHREH